MNEAALERRISRVTDRATLAAVVLLAALGLALAFPRSGGPLLASVVWAICLVVLARASPQGPFSFAWMYLLFLGLFHLGLAVPIALGIGPDDPFPRWLEGRDLAIPIALFTTATLSFTAGVTIFAPPPIRDEWNPPMASHAPLLATGLAVAAVGTVLFGIGVARVGLLSGAYGDFYARALSEDVRFFGFGFMLFPIGFVVAAVGATPRQTKLLAVAYACVAGPVFVAGFRGPTLVHATALLLVWMRKDPRVARRVALVAAGILVVLLPAIKASRNLDRSLEEGAKRAQPLDLLFEFGGSIRPLVVTCERVESRAEPLWMGESYLKAVGRVVPNVSTRWRPKGHFIAPGAWATMHEAPLMYERGGGIGFSAVAEPYLNFGRPGLVAFFLLLGAFLNRCERWMSRGGYRAAIAASTYGFVLWTVRNDAMGAVRPFALAALTVFGAWALSRVRRARGGIA